MAFEVPVKIGLVGEVVFANKFLKSLVGIHECYLQLYYRVVVDYVLGILSGCSLAYGIEAACGERELVGIKLHGTFCSKVLGYEVAELEECLFLVFESYLFFHLFFA